jgi:hypothetical protein
VGERDRIERTIMEGLVERTESVLGRVWDLSVRQATSPLSCAIVHRLESLGADSLGTEWLDFDKVFALSVTPLPHGYRIAAREFDCRTRIWGAVRQQDASQPGGLVTVAFQVLIDVFAPLAHAELDADGKVTLHPRASGLSPRDPSLHLIQDGDIYLPVLRRSDLDGKALTDGIQVVPWTLLVVDDARGSTVRCSMHSGIRRPLSTRKRGRIEQLALAIKFVSGSTRLVVRSRTEPHRPLAGYHVYARDPGAESAELLGETNSDGAIDIHPGTQRVRLLSVKNGAQVLASLPIDPGRVPELTAQIPDDQPRLEVEGFVRGLQDNLVDVVARREILSARARRQLEAKNFEGAGKSLDEIQKLPTRQFFLQSISQMRQQSRSDDPYVQARIDSLFAQTEKLLVSFLDPRTINELQSTFDEASKRRSGK